MSYGLNTSGAGGFLLSFVPPVVALILGVYLKKEGFHSKHFVVKESPIGDEHDTSAVAIETKDMEMKTSVGAIILSNDSIIAPTQHPETDLLAKSSSLVEPLLNDNS